MKIHLDNNTIKGTLFLTQENKIAIYLGKKKGNGKFSFRFRLLGEHLLMQEWIRIFKPTLFDISDEILKESQILKIMGIEHSAGDWYVRTNGLVTDSNVVFQRSITSVLPDDNQIYITKIQNTH